MKYIVTGASGLIGKELVLKLAESGHSVTAIYRNNLPERFLDFNNINLAKGNIEDLGFLRNAMHEADGVFHVAAFARPWNKDKSVYYRINEHGTSNVCATARDYGVKRLVYTSSGGIHGPQQSEVLIDENHWPQQYFTDYEQSKFNGQVAAFSYLSEGLEVVAVSPARVYAPTEPSESNVPARLVNIYINKGFGFVPAGGHGLGSYVHINDIVSGHIIAMQKGVSGEEYLLGGENVSYRTFFDIVGEIAGKHRPIINIPYQASLLIGKVNLFAAENLGIQPTITTPWVRRYIQNWGVNSSKILDLGYQITPLKEGLAQVVHKMMSI